MRIYLSLALSLLISHMAFGDVVSKKKHTAAKAGSIAVANTSPKPDDPAPAIPSLPDLDGQTLYKRVLPSIVTLSVDLKSGDKCTGTGFLAIKDGIAVTAWHVVNGAKHVTAKFSSGEEFEVSGLVDKDENQDVAIVHVKVVERPLLNLGTGDPEIGSKAYAIGTPLGVLDFSISDGLISQIRTDSGVKYYQFTSAVSPGNSGGPLLNSKGEVIGIVDAQTEAGQNLNFALPISYAKALDATLPTQPWDTVQATLLPEDTSKPGPDDDLDKAMADSFVMQGEAAIALVYLDTLAAQNGGYNDEIPPKVYRVLSNLHPQFTVLYAMHTEDAARERVRQILCNNLARRYGQLNLLIRAVQQARADQGWSKTAKREQTQSNAFLKDIKGIAPEDMDILWHSPAFTKEMPDVIDSKEAMAAADTVTKTLGLIPWPSDDLHIAVVHNGRLADQFGLQNDDILQSIGGTELHSLAEFEKVIEQNVDSKINVVVMRGANQVELRIVIPKQLPQ